MNKPPDSTYSNEITGRDFVIDKNVASRIIKKSKEGHRTVSDVLAELVCHALLEKGFSELKIYENGREDPEQFASVGPYSFLSSKAIKKHGQKYAYYVFENYPRDSENRLKNGEIKHFKEHGNWRRDLLPPNVAIGCLFDIDSEVINVRILVRKNQESPETVAETYWNELINTTNKEI